jgi:hypothetical protein
MRPESAKKGGWVIPSLGGDTSIIKNNHQMVVSKEGIAFKKHIRSTVTEST